MYCGCSSDRSSVAWILTGLPGTGYLSTTRGELCNPYHAELAVLLGTLHCATQSGGIVFTFVARYQLVLQRVFTPYECPECPDYLLAPCIDTARAMCAHLRRRVAIEYACVEADDILVKPSDFLAGVCMCEVVSYALEGEQAAVYDGFPFECMDLFGIQHKKRKR